MAVLAAAASPARAALITSVGQSSLSGSGIGSVPTIMTLQNTSNESGSVTWDGSADVISGVGVKTGASQTKTITQADIAAAFPGFSFSTNNLLLILNLNQVNKPYTVDLNAMALFFYNAAGAQVDSASLAAAIPGLQDTGVGVGSSGAGFLITGINPTAVRVGMSASLGLTDDGPDTFFVGDGGKIDDGTGTGTGDPVAAPAPAGLVLAGLGLPALGLLRRRAG